MKLHNLKPIEGTNRKDRRIGRGQGSTKGGTATKGTKGARARTGYNFKAGFEGGQMPIHRRMPKYGFKNPFRVEYKVVNLEQLQHLADTKGLSVFTKETYVDNGLMSNTDHLVKILGRGELKASITVHADAASATALSAIQAQGGQVVLAEAKPEFRSPKPQRDAQ